MLNTHWQAVWDSRRREEPPPQRRARMSKALHKAAAPCAGTAMVIDDDEVRRKAMEARAGTLAPLQIAAEQRVDAWRVKRREALEGRTQAGHCWRANAAAVSVDGAQGLW